jgi:hypothetical protein
VATSTDFAHGRVVGRPRASSAHDNVQGPDGAHGGASGGTHIGCEKAGQRVASNGARSSACGGANGGRSGQGADGAYGGASGGTRADCDEGRADRRVGRVAAVAPVAMPTGPPATATAPTTCSREAAAAA